MRRILAVLILSFLSAFGFSIHSIAAVKSEGNTPHVLINEIAFGTTDPSACWFELYNPAENSVNLDNWELYVIGIYGSFHLPVNVTIPPDGYVVITSSKENFASYWGISPDAINVYEGFVPDNYVKLLERGFEICGVQNGMDICDFLESPSEYPLDHSWARYAGGYDTDNFANDFYDEPNPTPGWANPRVKEGENVQPDNTLLIAIGAGAAIALLAALFYLKRVRK